MIDLIDVFVNFPAFTLLCMAGHGMNGSDLTLPAVLYVLIISDNKTSLLVCMDVNVQCGSLELSRLDLLLCVQC